jgi:type VI secretion system protein ImpJ
MSTYNKVVWSEGLFLRPQHFQQQDRYFERYVETRCHALSPHSWGFSELELERDLLKIGKFGLRRAAGVFPDGTPFRMPDDDPLPAPIDLGRNVRDEVLYLALPVRRAGAAEVDRTAASDGLVRHEVREFEARDAVSSSGDTALLEVGALRTRMVLASDVTQAYACVPMAHVVETRADNQVMLDEAFIPTVLDARAATRLATFMTELVGMLHQRGDHLSGRVTSSGRGGAAEIGEFLTLQVINRYEPLIAHLAASGVVHPEDLFRIFVQMLGEFSTFATTSKRPIALPGYRHHELRESFDTIIRELPRLITAVSDTTAIPIPIESRRFGLHFAPVADRSLYTTADFVLAARAEMVSEELRRRFPAQLKIGPVEKIRDLVNLALPGVPVHALPVAPRQIPFHAGYAYFELDQSHELWAQMPTSGGVAMFVPEIAFPGLAMEFWAIRRQRD